jgi:hypothetical protein
MKDTSGGSQVDPKQFLNGKVEEVLSKLQRERMPSGFQQLAHGEVPEDIKYKAATGQIIV